LENGAIGRVDVKTEIHVGGLAGDDLAADRIDANDDARARNALAGRGFGADDPPTSLQLL
jgi:hypothetical protein